MNLQELVATRALVITAQARAVNVQAALEMSVGTGAAKARVELGGVDDALAEAAKLLEDAIHRERNGSGS